MRRTRLLVGAAAAAALAAAAVPLLIPNTATAAQFTGGNLVVYRVGSGSAALSNAAAPVFLDEVSPTGTAVQSVALPTSTVDDNAPLTATGLSRSEGLISRSQDGKFLAVTGYDAAVGGTGPNGLSLTATAPASVPRTVGLVDANGTVDTSTLLSGAGTPQIIRSAATPDGDRLYAAGGNGGLLTTTLGLGSAGVATAPSSNLASLSYQDNQLFASGLVTNRLALNGSGGLTDLPGMPSNLLAYGYALLDLTPQSYAGTGIDTLYLANGSERSGTVDRYSWNGTTWVAQGFIDVPGAFGLVANASGSNVSLAVTTPTKLLLLNDTTPTASTFAPAAPTTLATAATNTEFRGVALAPTGNNSAPSLFVRTPATGSSTPLSQGTLNFSGVAKAASGAISSVSVQLNGGAPVAATKGAGDVWSASLPLAGSVAGARTLTVTATDNAGTPRTTTVNRTFTLANDVPPPNPAPPVPAGNAGPGTYALTSSLVTRKGAWATYAVPSAPGKKGLTAKAKNRTLSTKVFGSSVALTFSTRKNAGKANVTVDGRTTVVNLFAKKPGSLVKRFAFPGAVRSHTVVITVTGKKAPKSKGTGVFAALFQVTN